jgi:hypothetical protein
MGQKATSDPATSLPCLEVMLERRCIEGGTSKEGRATLELARIAEETDALNEKRRHIFEAYAKEQMCAEDYIEASRAIDEGIVRLRRKRDAS